MAKLSKEGTSNHDGYIYGVAALEFKGKDVGEIASDGLDWGGDKPQQVSIRCAQRPHVPVKVLIGQPGTTVISGKLIKLRPENLKHLIGGEVAGTKWTPPTAPLTQEGAFSIRSLDGVTIAEGKCSLTAKLGGKLVHNDLLYVDFELTIISDGSAAPYTIDFGA